jgi:hypothetical protein
MHLALNADYWKPCPELKGNHYYDALVREVKGANCTAWASLLDDLPEESDDEEEE